MRVLVIGGGVAGPAVALAAANLGVDVTVLERRAVSDPHEGSWITVAPNGLDALDALGVLDRVRSVGHPSRLNRMFGATGRHLGDVALGTPLDDGSVALTMKRSALAVELVDAARAVGAQVRLGARVVTTADDGNEVVATLEDGTTLRADVLVGADGVHSRVRRALDPAAPPARYVGLTNFGGLSTSSSVAGELEPEAWHFVFGRRSFFGAHPLPTGDVVWFVNVPRDEICHGGTRGDDRRAVALVARRPRRGRRRARPPDSSRTASSSWPATTPTTCRTSRRGGEGRTVIVGDAAHAPSPSSGQGAAMALEDAVVLARVAGRHGRAGLPAYEQARRTRVEAVVRAGARSSSAKIPGRVGRVVQEAALRAVFGSGLAARSTAALTAHRLGPAPVDVRRD